MTRPRPWQKEGRLPGPSMTDDKLLEEWAHMRWILGEQQARKRLADAFNTTEDYIYHRLRLLELEKKEAMIKEILERNEL